MASDLSETELSRQLNNDAKLINTLLSHVNKTSSISTKALANLALVVLNTDLYSWAKNPVEFPEIDLSRPSNRYKSLFKNNIYKLSSLNRFRKEYITLINKIKKTFPQLPLNQIVLPQAKDIFFAKKIALTVMLESQDYRLIAPISMEEQKVILDIIMSIVNTEPKLLEAYLKFVHYLYKNYPEHNRRELIQSNFNQVLSQYLHGQDNIAKRPKFIALLKQYPFDLSQILQFALNNTWSEADFTKLLAGSTSINNIDDNFFANILKATNYSWELLLNIEKKALEYSADNSLLDEVTKLLLANELSITDSHALTKKTNMFSRINSLSIFVQSESTRTKTIPNNVLQQLLWLNSNKEAPRFIGGSIYTYLYNNNLSSYFELQQDKIIQPSKQDILFLLKQDLPDSIKLKLLTDNSYSCKLDTSNLFLEACRLFPHNNTLLDSLVNEKLNLTALVDGNFVYNLAIKYNLTENILDNLGAKLAGFWTIADKYNNYPLLELMKLGNSLNWLSSMTAMKQHDFNFSLQAKDSALKIALNNEYPIFDIHFIIEQGCLNLGNKHNLAAIFLYLDLLKKRNYNFTSWQSTIFEKLLQAMPENSLNYDNKTLLQILLDKRLANFLAFLPNAMAKYSQIEQQDLITIASNNGQCEATINTLLAKGYKVSSKELDALIKAHYSADLIATAINNWQPEIRTTSKVADLSYLSTNVITKLLYKGLDLLPKQANLILQKFCLTENFCSEELFNLLSRYLTLDDKITYLCHLVAHKAPLKIINGFNLTGDIKCPDGKMLVEQTTDKAILNLLRAKGAKFKNENTFSKASDTFIDGIKQTALACSLMAGLSLFWYYRGGKKNLHEACIAGNHSEIESLITAGAKIDAPNANGELPLNIAIRHNNIPAIELLLAHGATLVIDHRCNLKQFNDWTPLHFAVFNEQAAICELLVALGADRYALNQDKQTPIELALTKNNRKIITILEQDFAKYNT